MLCPLLLTKIQSKGCDPCICLHAVHALSLDVAANGELSVLSWGKAKLAGGTANFFVYLQIAGSICQVPFNRCTGHHHDDQNQHSLSGTPYMLSHAGVS